MCVICIILGDCIYQVFSIDMARLLAGASNRAEFEERLTKIVDEMKLSEGKSFCLLMNFTHLLELAFRGLLMLLTLTNQY